LKHTQPTKLYSLFNARVNNNIVAQSICTHYSSKLGTLLFEKKKQSAKNQGHCNSKREEAAWSLLFLNKE
jgi:hypothetical protein